MSAIRLRDLFRVSARLALLQSTWCEGGMQSVGLAYSLVPGLNRLFPARDDLTAALRRHEEPINTHPFLAGVIAGSMLRLEEEAWKPRDLATFKRGAMGPLAAVGDPFFEGALGPLAAIIVVLATTMGGPLVGIVTIFAVFSLLHGLGRLAGVLVGYRDGHLVTGRIATWLGPSRTRLLRVCAAVLAGFVPIALALQFSIAGPWWTAAIIGLGGLAVAAFLKGRQRSRAHIAPALLAVLLLLEVLL